jgi:sugar lactone lactonase YvrE
VTTAVPVEGSDSLVLVGSTDGVALVDLDKGASSWLPHPSSGSLHGSNGRSSNSSSGSSSYDDAAKEGQEVFVRMNDGKCDPQGRFWVGSIARHGGGPGGDLFTGGAALYRLDGWAGTPFQVLGGLTVSNGLAWSLDGLTMYATDSPTGRVDALDFDGETGAVSNRRAAVRVSEAFPPVPDGCCLDSEGMLWVACFGAGEVRRYDLATDEARPRLATAGDHGGDLWPGARLLATVQLPPDAGGQCTAVAFGGPKMDALFITTAHEFWDEAQQAACPLAGALFTVGRDELRAKLGRVVTGLPTRAFKL